MSVKNGTLTLTLTSGKDTGIKGYIDWHTEHVSGNTYTMYIDFYAYANVTGVTGSRTCSYSFWVYESVLVDNATVSFTSSAYKCIYSTSFNIEVDDYGFWDGYFGGEFSFESTTYGTYSVYGQTSEGMIAGAANYTVSYYMGYGSNDIFYTDPNTYDTNATCSITYQIPSRPNDTDTDKFTIKGNKNGGDVDITATATKKNTTTYTFEGWSETYGASSATYNTADTFTITGSVILYAIWSSNTSTTYSNNTIGALTPNPTKASEGGFYNITLIYNNGQGATTIEAGSFTKYTFKGWASSKSSTTALSASKAYTSGVEVYAIWEPSTENKSTVELPSSLNKDSQTIATYTVTLDPNGGSVNSTSKTSSKTKSYTFKGWSTVSEDSNYIVSNTYTPTNKSDHSLYAIWTETESVDSISLPVPTYPTFKFLGWAVNPNSTSYVSMAYTPEQDITLYAIYKASYTGETYVWNNGAWHRVIPHLRYEDVFNGCINSN